MRACTLAALLCAPLSACSPIRVLSHSEANKTRLAGAGEQRRYAEYAGAPERATLYDGQSIIHPIIP